ncbi:MAG: carboxypeptidase regulatory-like domain-containing protein [Nannocystaceae bacterium]
MVASGIVLLTGPSGEQFELSAARDLDARSGWVITDGRYAASIVRAHRLGANTGARVVLRLLRELVEAWAPMANVPLSDDEVVDRVATELEHGDGGRLVLRQLDAPRVVADRFEPGYEPVVDLADLSEVPPPEQTTWFELCVEDELGEPLSDVALGFGIDGAIESVTTDGSGKARYDGARTSFGSAKVTDQASLRDTLVERWSEARGQPWKTHEGLSEHTILPFTEPLPEIPLRSETPHTVVLQPRVSRARLVGGLFDTNKTFLLPAALHQVQSIRALYEQHPGAELLLVGHTDTSGEVSYNETLSVERAESMKAYLTDDVDAWLDWYDSGTPSSKRWGELEDRMMLEAVLFRRGQLPAARPVETFQQGEGLVDDGIIGPNTRRALVTAYMGIDGTTLPEGIEPITHGCGEAFSLAEDGVALDYAPRDGEDDPADRRVELFFFDPPLPVLPPPPGSSSGSGSAEYPEWRLRAQQTRDFVVRKAKAIAVKVTDADTDEPLAGAQVTLTRTIPQGVDAKPTGGGPAKPTDSFGVAVFDDIDDGSYQVGVERTSHTGEVVDHEVAPGDPPQVIPVALGTAVGDLVVQVKDQHSGAELEGVDVRIDGPQSEGALTQADGTATFSDLPTGAYDVKVAAADFSVFTGAATVTAGATAAVPVILVSTKARQGNLAVTVKAKGGGPVAGADVRLAGGASSTVTTDAKGEAMLGPIDEGTHELQALADWFALGTMEVSVDPDQTKTITITLEPLKVDLKARLYYDRTWDYNAHATPIAAVKETLPGVKVELRIKPKGGSSLTTHATDHADKDGKVEFKAVPQADAIELRVVLEHQGGKIVAFKGNSNIVTQADFEVKTNKSAWHQLPLSAASMGKIDGKTASVNLGDIEITKALFVDMCDCYKSIWFGHTQIKKLASTTLPYCEIRYPSTTTSFHRGGKLHILKDDLKDRDVLLHEYGHFITAKMPGSKTQGYKYDDGNGTIGSHNRTSKEHYESAWTEGIATFLSCAMTNDPHYHDGYDTNLSYHLDSDNTQVGAHAEGSIQEALWDTYKVQGVTFKKMWAALTNTSKRVVNTAVQYHDNWSELGIADHAKLVTAYHKFSMKYVYGYRDGGDRFEAVVAPKTFSAASKEFTTVDELFDNFGKLGGGTKADYKEEFYNRNKKFNAGALGAGSSRTNPKITAGNKYIVPERKEIK